MSLGLLLLAVTLTGCGQPRSKVFGTIRYQGKALVGATVAFLTSDNQPYRTTTRVDGAYEISGVPQGEVRVAIIVEEPRAWPKAEPNLRSTDSFARGESLADDAAKKARMVSLPTPAEPVLRFPPIYAIPEQSGLKFNLTQPEQEYSTDLK
jgi:hypothetical protein